MGLHAAPPGVLAGPAAGGPGNLRWPAVGMGGVWAGEGEGRRSKANTALWGQRP